jgi:hypothetical protein
MLKNLSLALLLVFILNIKSQTEIKPMVCEGPIPKDLKQSIDDIVNNENSTTFNKKTF